MMKALIVILVVFNFFVLSFICIAKEGLTEEVQIDGSSSVYPFAKKITEKFLKKYPNRKVSVQYSGTGGGFKKFCAGEIDISNASRLMNKTESKKCHQNKIEFIKVALAYDGIAVILHKNNTWASKLTMLDLKKIWEPGSKVVKWSDVRSYWPLKTIKLYGPGSASGTFDYFTKKVNGKEGLSRSNYIASENDTLIINGVAMDQYTLGYVGFGVAQAHKSRLQVSSINGVKPSDLNLKKIKISPSYTLFRNIYMYVSKKSLKQKHISSFVSFYLQSSKKVADEISGYVPLEDLHYKHELKGLSKILKDKAMVPE